MGGLLTATDRKITGREPEGSAGGTAWKSESWCDRFRETPLLCRLCDRTATSLNYLNGRCENLKWKQKKNQPRLWIDRSATQQPIRGMKMGQFWCQRTQRITELFNGRFHQLSGVWPFNQLHLDRINDQDIEENPKSNLWPINMEISINSRKWSFNRTRSLIG